MGDKLLNKEITQEKPGASSDLRYTDNSLQNTFFDLFKPHVLSAIENMQKKKKCPYVDSIFDYIAKRFSYKH